MGITLAVKTPTLTNSKFEISSRGFFCLGLIYVANTTDIQDLSRGGLVPQGPAHPREYGTLRTTKGEGLLPASPSRTVAKKPENRSLHPSIQGRKATTLRRVARKVQIKGDATLLQKISRVRPIPEGPGILRIADLTRSKWNARTKS